MANITDKVVASDKGSEVGGATYTKFYAYAEIIATEETSTQVRLSARTYVYLTGEGLSGTIITYSGSFYDSSKTFTCGSSAATYGSTTKDLGWIKRGSSTNTYNITAQYTSSSGTVYKSTASVSYKVPTTAISLSTYTISYNANGGSGAPSSQTKWQGESLILSSAKPTRTGYTFLGWDTSSSATSATYSAGGSYTSNSATTLYAVWRENVLTVKYYSNYADYYSLEGAIQEIDSSKSEYLLSNTYKYATTHSSGLADVQNPDYVYLSRTGYTPTGKWGTAANGGKIVDQSDSYTGQALAVALGVSLDNGDVEVNVYPQWRENYLTVTYYSNYADYYGGSKEALNGVNGLANTPIYTQNFEYATAYTSTDTSEGLLDYTDSANDLYMTRTKHNATGLWCTTAATNIKIDCAKNETAKYDGGIAVGENVTFDSGQELAETLGLSLESGDALISLYPHWLEVYTITYDDNVDDDSVENMPLTSQTKECFSTLTLSNATPDRFQYNFKGWATSANGAPAYSPGSEYYADADVTLYAVWELSASTLTLYDDNGDERTGLLYMYDPNGILHFGIMYAYDSDGNLHSVG